MFEKWLNSHANRHCAESLWEFGTPWKWRKYVTNPRLRLRLGLAVEPPGTWFQYAGFCTLNAEQVPVSKWPKAFGWNLMGIQNTTLVHVSVLTLTSHTLNCRKKHAKWPHYANFSACYIEQMLKSTRCGPVSWNFERIQDNTQIRDFVRTFMSYPVTRSKSADLCTSNVKQVHMLHHPRQLAENLREHGINT